MNIEEVYNIVQCDYLINIRTGIQTKKQKNCFRKVRLVYIKPLMMVNNIHQI
jgi:hypothetical protein